MPLVNWEEIKSSDTTVTPVSFDPWPRGSKTRCMIERVTHESRPGKGRCFAVGFRSVEGDNEGQWAWMNAWTERKSGRDTDAQTVAIGLRKVASLYEVLGLPLPDDTDNLNPNDSLESLVTVVAGKPNTWKNREGEPQVTTEIVSFESAVPQAPPAEVVATPVNAADDDAPF